MVLIREHDGVNWALFRGYSVFDIHCLIVAKFLLEIEMPHDKLTHQTIKTTLNAYKGHFSERLEQIKFSRIRA